MVRRTMGVVWSKSTCPFFIGSRSMPKPSADTFTPVRPIGRYCICGL